MSNDRTDGLASRVPVIAIELAVLGVVWWFLIRDTLVIGLLAGVAVAAGLSPRRWEPLVSGLGLIAVAGVVYCSRHAMGLAIVLAVVGVLIALSRLLSPGRGRGQS